MASELRRRRWPLVLGIVILVLAVGAAGIWYVFLPYWRPSLEPGERFGIDVSNHQGVVDWEAVAGDGISFAYVKATEGGDWVDKQFAANWAGTGKAGLDRGVYHFFSLCTDGTSQAEHFLRVAKPDPRALAPAVDLETAGNCAKRPDQKTVAKELKTFVDLVEDAWERPMVLYVGADWEGVYPVRLDRPRWHRDLVFRPDFGWHIWQIHGFADVEGVATRVDLNIMRP
jgi:lysozyme